MSLSLPIALVFRQVRDVFGTGSSVREEFQMGPAKPGYAKKTVTSGSLEGYSPATKPPTPPKNHPEERAFRALPALGEFFR